MSYEVQNFQEDVIRASATEPVVVDFWAPWCGPCRVLGPVLEKLAGEQNGRWRLAKVDTDQNPELSTQYGIRGIPAVKLFVDGKVAGEFTGALPEPAVRKWLDEVIPTEGAKKLQHAELLMAEGRVDEAAGVLESILSENPADSTAAGLLAIVLAFDDPKRARDLATLAADEPRFANTAEAISDLVAFREKHEQADAFMDQEGGQDYAEASRHLGDGDIGEAVLALIEVLKKNRYLDDDGARRAGVAIFSLLGDRHPITRTHRRMFDMWLY